MPDFKKYYNDPVYPTTVSRDVPPGEYSWDSITYQSGRAILDSDLNLAQDAAEYARLLLAGKSLPSGFLRAQSSRDSFADYGFVVAVPGGENVFTLAKQTAWVSGMPVVVEYTSVATSGLNLINLPAPSTSSGVAPDIKRTDFVFLEVWRTLVAPSPRAFGTITSAAIVGGDKVLINASFAPVFGPLVMLEAGTHYAVGANETITASNLAAAINASVLYPNYVSANTFGTSVVTVTATFGGTDGNVITLIPSAPAHSPVTSPLAGGANRANKPTQNSVYRHGNVESAPSKWLADELVDPVVNVETTQRVQVQYRLRVYSDAIAGVNPKTEPDGFSNAGLEAQGAQAAPVATYPFVPADGVTVSGSSDASLYGFVDQGLHVAGDGTQASAVALGTVDGFVYAIPVCFVFRRTDASGTGGFNPDLTANSGVLVAHGGFNNTHLDPLGPVPIVAGRSDRPDGLFADVIAASDVLDLRRHVTPPGYDFGTELKYQLQSLLDKRLSTWQVDASDWTVIGSGSGEQSSHPLLCDQVGRGPVSSRGQTIRQFDHIARRFGSQSVVERVVLEVFPNPIKNPTGITVTKSLLLATTWCEGDEIEINLGVGGLNPTTLQGWTTPALVTFVSAVWPTDTKVTDIISVFHDDGHSVTPVDQATQLASVTGIGTTTLVLTLDADPQLVDAPPGFGPTVISHPIVADPLVALDNGSARRLFVELEVTYPTGAGLSHTPDLLVTPDPLSGFLDYTAGAIIEDDSTQRPPEMLTAWVPNPKFRSGYREVKLEQKTAPAAIRVLDFVVTRTSTTVYPPRRFFEDLLTVSTPVPVFPVAAATTFGSSERLITLPIPGVSNQTVVQVDYYSQDPVPNAGAAGYRTAIYYRSQAPQTAGVQTGGASPTLPAQLVVEPVAVSSEVWTGQSGKGATDLGFPYESALDQIPVASVGVVPPVKEWYFSALAEVSISDFSAATGLLSLHSFVQVDGTNTIQLGDTVSGRGSLTDAEFRAYYDFANPAGYKPTAAAQPLFGPTRHKTFQPMLVRSTADTLLFRKGELLLLVLSQFQELNPDNKVAFTDLPAIRTSAAIYRTRNLLLTVGD